MFVFPYSMLSLLCVLIAAVGARVYQKSSFARQTLIGSLLEVTASVAAHEGRCTLSMRTLSIAGSAAQSSGVVSLATCAQYVKDQSSLGKSVGSFVSWSNAEATCEGFSACACASGGVCNGEEGWLSVAISDVIIPSKGPALTTTSGSNAPPPTVMETKKPVDPLATSATETCDDSYIDLIKTFQTRCKLSRTTKLMRLIGLLTVLALAFLLGGAFYVANTLDQMEIKGAQSSA